MSSESYNIPSLAPYATVINIIPYSENQGGNRMKEDSINESKEGIKNQARTHQAITKAMNVIDLVNYGDKNQRGREPETQNNDGYNDVYKFVEPNRSKVESLKFEDNNPELINGTANSRNENGYQEYEHYNSESDRIEDIAAENQNGYQTSDDDVNEDADVIEVMAYYVEEQNGEQMPENYTEDTKVIDEGFIESENKNSENYKYTIDVNYSVDEKTELNMYRKNSDYSNDLDVTDDIVPKVENQNGHHRMPDTYTNESDTYAIAHKDSNGHQMNEVLNNDRSAGGALATTEGSFSTFLAPLNKASFKEVVDGVEEKLRTVNQTLAMLTNSQGFETILQEMLNSITLKTGELLAADRTTIFLIDHEKNELWSIVAKGDGAGTIEIRIPADRGIAGEVATFKKVVNIPYDFFDDPRSSQSRKMFERTGYRTYTMLALPLLNEQGELVAVVQLLNKLKFTHASEKPLEERIDLEGFTKEDERVFEEFAPSIRLILESSRSFYVATQKQRAAEALMKANQALSQSSLDLEETLKRVMDEARKLMNADRSTLWLIDHERDQLWTKIPVGSELKEMRIPRNGSSFAAIVARSGEPLMISFDLYDDPRSGTSKRTDPETGYRTCSLLCMPVFNANDELIGVTQLINKKRQGDWPDYNPADWPKAPECWKASFNRSDLEFMQIFNIQAGVALQNAKLFAEVKQQQQMQRDILRSLTNGVISTDKAGNVIAANESAKRLLGLSEDERIEGKPASELVKIKTKDEQDDKFSQWFKAALEANDEKKRKQYYPDQILEAKNDKQHSVNLSINTIADVNDAGKVRGALVVMDDISHEKRLKSTMYRYMTQEVAEQLLARGDDFKMGGDRKEVTVLFSDIRSYTTLTETMEAEEVVQMLNEYFELMVAAVFKHKGTLDKYIGDAIMAVFGAFVPLPDHAWQAVQTAVEMRHRLSRFNADRRSRNQKEIKIGIGINSDTVISGNIGSSQRMELTSIGDGINLGSRLEGASKQYGCDIIVSQYTFERCSDKTIYHRELDLIRVKGRNQPVSIYELVALDEQEIPKDCRDKTLNKIDIYHKGREYYLKQQFKEAMNEFSTIVQDIDNKDKPSLLHLDRCNYWLRNREKLETEWDDGVWSLTEK